MRFTWCVETYDSAYNKVLYWNYSFPCPHAQRCAVHVSAVACARILQRDRQVQELRFLSDLDELNGEAPSSGRRLISTAAIKITRS